MTDFCSNIEYTKRVAISQLKYAKTKDQAAYLDNIICDGVKNVIFNRLREELNPAEQAVFDEINEKQANLNQLEKSVDINSELKEIERLKRLISTKIENILMVTSFYHESNGKRSKKLAKDSPDNIHSPTPIKKVKVIKKISCAEILKKLPGSEEAERNI